jgi:hypothetical protein
MLALVEEYHVFIDGEDGQGHSFDNVVQNEMDKFEATLAAEYASLDAQYTSSFAAWNQQAADAVA